MIASGPRSLEDSLVDPTLQELLVAAGESPPDRRIEYRDRIAAFGRLAIIEMTRWADDPQYAGFAVRVIGRAAAFEARPEAVAALRRLETTSEYSHVRGDARSELMRLGAPNARSSPNKPRAARPAPRDGALNVDDLVVGRTYRRRDLHDGGLGGNPQAGISYPAQGDHVLLFSDPTSRDVYGYKDSPSGTDGYRYFGGWNGAADMALTGGNRAIVDRSPNLHLFVAAPKGFRYEGRFELARHDLEWTERDGRAQQAIVFQLRRANP